MIAGSVACVTTVAGSSQPGNADGMNASARLLRPDSCSSRDKYGCLLIAGFTIACLRVVEVSLAVPRRLLAAKMRQQEWIDHNSKLCLQVHTQSCALLLLTVPSVA